MLHTMYRSSVCLMIFPPTTPCRSTACSYIHITPFFFRFILMPCLLNVYFVSLLAMTSVVPLSSIIHHCSVVCMYYLLMFFLLRYRSTNQVYHQNKKPCTQNTFFPRSILNTSIFLLKLSLPLVSVCITSDFLTSPPVLWLQLRVLLIRCQMTLLKYIRMPHPV